MYIYIYIYIYISSIWLDTWMVGLACGGVGRISKKLSWARLEFANFVSWAEHCILEPSGPIHHWIHIDKNVVSTQPLPLICWKNGTINKVALYVLIWEAHHNQNLLTNNLYTQRKGNKYISIFSYLFLYMNAKYINHITKWMASRVLNYGHK